MKKKEMKTGKPVRDGGHNIHNNMFIKTFSDPENVRSLLKTALPQPLKNAVDFSKIEIDPTTYISDDIKDYYSDIVVKTRLKTVVPDEPTIEGIPLDIYILVEHKTRAKNKSLVQMLKYMYLEWQKDTDEGRPLRVIIPMVFYHGKKKWKVPQNFSELFNVDDEIKKYLLNYRYILFDTREWDFFAEENKELRNNVFLFTALVLMKSAYHNDMETIKAIFRLWYEKGFIKNKEKVLFFLLYVSYIRDIPLEELDRTLKESSIKGGDFMPSLAQRLIEQGIEQGIEKGTKENAKEVAKRMLNDDIPIATISKYTGLSEKEIRSLMS
jgi:predicted transposase/invertase (TIGR01784 family)